MKPRFLFATSVIVATACGDRGAAPTAGSVAPPSTAEEATREMDEVVARIASGAPVDPKEAKAKALRDAKSFGVLGVASQTGEDARLASAWVEASKLPASSGAPVLDEPGKSSGPPTVTIVSLTTTPPSPAIDKQLREQELAKVERCFAEGRTTDASQRGTLDVRLSIDVAGVVKESTGDRTAPSPGVAGCARKALFDARFAAPAEPTQARLEIAFDPGAARAASPPVGPTIAGKPVADATAADVAKALTVVGCTDVKDEPKPKSKGARLLTATCDAKPVTITFVPRKGRGDELDVDEVTRLVQVAAIHRDGPFFLAIEHGDRAAAEALLSRIVEHRG